MPNKVLFFVDDEAALTPYIVCAREEALFGEWEIRGSGALEQVVAWAKSSQARVVFIVDSRMPMPRSVKDEVRRLLTGNGLSEKDTDELLAKEVLSGTLSTVLLRELSPKSRVIVVTMFYREVVQERSNNPILDKILKGCIDVTVAKKSPAEFMETIESQVDALDHP